MQPLGWIFLTVVGVAIIAAVSYCLTRVMRAEVADGKTRKSRAKSD
jgi:hypothetical protein